MVSGFSEFTARSPRPAVSRRTKVRSLDDRRRIGAEANGGCLLPVECGRKEAASVVSLAPTPDWSAATARSKLLGQFRSVEGNGQCWKKY
ncbi:hypothetical protein ElyMa_000204200 [Elysia marginata]|uniref:Uncharacterized protein n=1 Tax=Elysia marginata TaxID=1093978 RepID=A0AAV4EX29_9GAST|nr:hypothetical protein ElyMa_000204200 [Elysia marginata]